MMTAPQLTAGQVVVGRVGVLACARCGNGHASVEWQYFAQPPRFPGVTAVAWALCPITGEPLLLAVAA